MFDACHSGALTRFKGAHPIPSIKIHSEDSLKGQVIITSSAANEFSQESDELQSSFFTHHFISALRGAADQNGDKKVSLMESYTYTYDKTVQHTSRTRAIQHPKASFRMETKGDFILSNLFRQKTGIVLASDLSGHYLVLSASNTVVAELDKKEGREIIIALMPGKYKIHKREKSHLTTAKLVLKKGQMAMVRTSKTSRRPLKKYTAKALSRRYSKWKHWKANWKPSLHLGISKSVPGLTLGLEAAMGPGWFARCAYAKRWVSHNPPQDFIKTYMAYNNYPVSEEHWLNFGWGKQFLLSRSLQLAGVMTFHRGWEKAWYDEKILYRYRTQCTDSSGNLSASADCHEWETQKSSPNQLTLLDRYAMSVQLELRLVLWPRVSGYAESGLGFRVRNLHSYVFQTHPPMIGIRIRI